MINVTLEHEKKIKVGSTLEIPVKTLSVAFTHKRAPEKAPEMTLCEVLAFPAEVKPSYANKQQAVSISLGQSTVFQGDGHTKADNFCRETGRKLSLSRALASCTQLSKAERGAVWQAYFSRS